MRTLPLNPAGITALALSGSGAAVAVIGFAAWTLVPLELLVRSIALYGVAMSILVVLEYRQGGQARARGAAIRAIAWGAFIAGAFVMARLLHPWASTQPELSGTWGLLLRRGGRAVGRGRGALVSPGRASRSTGLLTPQRAVWRRVRRDTVTTSIAAKWSARKATESAGAKEHFIDLCRG
jgi:hypothetical protein